MPERFDYVVVGAGSAGCVLANRLSADQSVTVALVEAGPRDRSLNIRIPPAFPKLFHSKYDWELSTTAQPELKARELYWPRGKTLGGSSSLNAMMWVRGAKADYDAWPAGWQYDDVLPYFQRAENRVGSNRGDVYGTGGPLYIEELRDPNPLRAAFFDACDEQGFRRLDELNDPSIDGYAPTPVTQRRGRRWSTADGYLRPVLRRPNLTLITGGLVEKVALTGNRAAGVVVNSRRGRRALTATREVILSAGAVHSPQLLQLSGIGDPEVLGVASIETRVASSGVGKGLQDHLSLPVIMFTKEPITLFGADKRPGELVKYLTQRRGQLTSNVGEAVLFGRSDPGLEHPDLEYIFAPVPFIEHGQVDPPGHGITIGVVLLQPESTGTVTIRSANASAAPDIDAGYLTGAADLARMVAGVDQCRQLFESDALRGHVTEKMMPTPDETDIAEYVRAAAETLYHPTGTCRMGTDDRAVVDLDLRVRGVDGLRVADASVIPQIIRGHTHAPSVMIGEKAADLIRNG
ncbi:MAG TPA: GMC family oxidoreductase N-terminal domain-containing protein [Jatrophihabitans sp.]|nr:GMC family oxidoreductase N-terminal domain-containing protein [Jatrophihabitans sp.]